MVIVDDHGAPTRVSGQQLWPWVAAAVGRPMTLCVRWAVTVLLSGRRDGSAGLTATLTLTPHPQRSASAPPPLTLTPHPHPDPNPHPHLPHIPDIGIGTSPVARVLESAGYLHDEDFFTYEYLKEGVDPILAEGARVREMREERRRQRREEEEDDDWGEESDLESAMGKDALDRKVRERERTVGMNGCKAE